ncbi:MAG TPA: hypothetical protein V6D12_07725 [Candidatus Obscuribacterales bacterium]
MNTTKTTTPKQFTETDIDEVKSVLAIAASCDDPELLARCREVYEPALLNVAAKRLSPEQHSQIMQWVLASKPRSASINAGLT